MSKIHFNESISYLLLEQKQFTGTETIGIENFKNPKAFIYYLQTIDNAYENLKDYNTTKKWSLNSV